MAITETLTNSISSNKNGIKLRFNGYLPIVVDVETAGVNPLKDALLEIAALPIISDPIGNLIPHKMFNCHVIPFEGANLDPIALEINKIKPFHPFRFAIDEIKALTELFNFTSNVLTETGCRRAILVGHNAHFDLSFIKAAMKRARIMEMPFHAFTCFDTATLGALIYGKTILAKVLKAAQIDFDKEQAHSAVYDTEKTAELFCKIVNQVNNKCS